ncbi:MAG TPA: hypothetical protein VK205_10745 [Prolixibacteraceae bacterium]|nr:hypothetical protein [Prolixibacteraceae bacterium]
MTKEFLLAESKAMNVLINELYIDPIGARKPITDGIVNTDHYLNAKYRILWILKEPYDEVKNGEGSGGGWDLCERFLNTSDFATRMHKSESTWMPVCYVVYGILNDLTYAGMQPLSKKEVAFAIKSIAVINISKLPALTKSFDKEMKEAYKRYKKILHQQIELFNPDIIIGGATLLYFREDLQLDLRLKKNVRQAVKNSRLYLSVYHPAQTKKTRQAYVDDIIGAVKEHYATIHETVM